MTKKIRSWSRTKKEKQHMSSEALAEHLALQLEHLVKIREGAARLMARDQLGRDFFARGETSFVSFAGKEDRLKDLVVAYDNVVNPKAKPPKVPKPKPSASTKNALEELPLFAHNEKARR